MSRAPGTAKPNPSCPGILREPGSWNKAQTHEFIQGKFHFKMGNRKSYCQPGAIHELTFSTFKKQHLLADSRDKQFVLDAICSAKSSQNFHLLAYAIMSNHIHLLIFPQSENYKISKILYAIKSPSAIKILARMKESKNKIYSLTEISAGRHRLWQTGGGYDRIITEPNEVITSIEYIENNPVKANLVRTSENYMYSSASDRKSPIPQLVDPLPF